MQHQNKTTKPHVVVLIEDDSVLQETFRDVLLGEGFKVTTASDGQEGLAIVRKQKPGIVLLDMLMPSLNGIEFLRQFDAKHHPETKIVVFSNLSDPEQMQQTLELGAVQYVVKSDLSLDQLIHLLEDL